MMNGLSGWVAAQCTSRCWSKPSSIPIATATPLSLAGSRHTHTDAWLPTGCRPALLALHPAELAQKTQSAELAQIMPCVGGASAPRQLIGLHRYRGRRSG